MKAFMNCFLCQSLQKEIFTYVESFNFPLVYYQCENCGLIFQSLEESQAADPEFYAETYRKIYQSSETPTLKDLWVQEQRAEHVMRLLTGQKTEKPARILDIGASSGILLNAFQEAFGGQVTGVEPGDAYRGFAEQSGLEMFPSLDALIKSAPERYDLVSLMHVLEHLPDPLGTLRIIRKNLLADDGCLLIEVPNFYAHDSFELAHLTCFTPHSLKALVRQAGYQVVLFDAHGEPRSSLLNLYLTLLAKPLPESVAVEPIRRDQCVRFKRRMGFLYRRVAQKLFPQQAWRPLPNENES